MRKNRCRLQCSFELLKALDVLDNFCITSFAMLAFNVLTAYSDISSVSNGNITAESAAIVDAKSGRRVIDLFTTLGTYTCCVSTFDSMFLKTAHFSSFELLVSSKDHKELNTVSGSDVAPGNT